MKRCKRIFPTQPVRLLVDPKGHVGLRLFWIRAATGIGVSHKPQRRWVIYPCFVDELIELERQLERSITTNISNIDTTGTFCSNSH